MTTSTKNRVIGGHPLQPTRLGPDGLEQPFPFYFAFEAAERVVDVGCGKGFHLRELRKQGCEAIGVEIDKGLIQQLTAEGLPVVEGTAESLPFPTEHFDGLISSVVIPYTDERKAIGEWARVLKRGGRARISYHGIAFALEYVVGQGHWKKRFYGCRQLVNTLYYQLVGCRLPGFLGDSLCQTTRRLRQYYRNAGLELVTEYIHPGLASFPRFIYHDLIKR